MPSGVYVLSCRLASGPLWLGIYLFLWWFLLVIFGLFLLHWRYELRCQDKLPEFHCTPILGCIRVLWLVFHPLGLGLDKALCGWNSVNKGTTEQFVLHFYEQFRQLEEISDESEHVPPQIKLQLLQNAVRPINDLRIVETLDEFQSIISGNVRSSSLK